MRHYFAKSKVVFRHAVQQQDASWVTWIRGAKSDCVSDMEQDIRDLEQLYRELTGEAPRVRVERTTGPGCKLFHADTVHQRMVCTYYGLGTELVRPADVDWHALEHPDLHASVEERNEKVVGDSSIYRLKPWEVVWMKGRLATDMPAVHRSPQDCTPRWVVFLDDLR